MPTLRVLQGAALSSGKKARDTTHLSQYTSLWTWGPCFIVCESVLISLSLQLKVKLESEIYNLDQWKTLVAMTMI